MFPVFRDFTPFSDGLGEYFLWVTSCLANSILGLDINLNKYFAIIVSYLVIAILTSIV